MQSATPPPSTDTPGAPGPEASAGVAPAPDWKQELRVRSQAAWAWVRFVLDVKPPSASAQTASTSASASASPTRPSSVGDEAAAGSSPSGEGNPATVPLGPQGWLREVLEPLRPAYLQVVLMSFGVSVIGLLTAVFTLQVYDRVVAKGGMSTLVALVAGMAIAVVLDYALRQGRGILMQRLGARIEAVIAQAVYERLTRLPALELEARPMAFWQTMFRDIELVRATTSGATALLLIDLPFLVFTLVLIGMIAWPVLPLAVVIMVAFMVLAWRSERVLRSGSEQEKEKLISRDVMLADLTASRLHLKSLGPSPAARKRWEHHYAVWMEESLARSRDMDHYRDVATSMSVATTVVMTSYGALAILNQLMSMGALIAANILAGKLVNPLVQLVSQWRTFGQFEASRKRLDQLLALPMDRQEAPVSLPRPQGVLKLENVHFRYPRTPHDQIHAITGQLGPHGLHAIVGANGSGKSTLLKLLRGLYTPSAGRVILDGGDIQQFGQTDLSRWIGFLTQQPRLVSGSVRDNISLGSDTATDEDIIRAARLAGAYDFIVNLPEGFDTDVGEGGLRFSGGQRKRIAIAQTLLSDPPIVLLDEPTSDLDAVAERELVATLKELSADHTVLVVTHSPSLLVQCNGILVLEQGKLAAAGAARDILPRLGMGFKPIAPAPGKPAEKATS